MKTSKKIKLLDLKFKKNLGSNLFGVYKTTFVGSGMEFSEIRQYDFGENIKNIDWKTTAKKGDLYIKKFEEERDLNVIFALDISQSMNFGTKDLSKKETLENIVYALGLSAIENNDNIGAMIFDQDIKHFIYPQKGYSNLYKILEKSQDESSENKDISKVFKEIIKRHIKKTLIFILTDNTEILEEKILKIASKENQIIFINIFDYFENNLANINSEMSFSFGNNFININLNSEKKNEYIEFRKQKLNQFKTKLQKNNIGYLYIDDSLNIYNELRKYFYKLS